MIMEKIDISIIIPIYNMEKYIENAIKSVEEQTIKDKEIIIIDDGSTDSSSAIIEKCIQNYSNVKILRQNNKGAGEARNLGIMNAIGEFVCFLDADDFYASNDVLEYLYKLAKAKSSYICGGSSGDYINGKISFEGIRKERRFLNDEYIQKENYPGITGYWAFIFQKEFLIKNKVFFPEYRRGQDAPFFIKAIAYAGKVYCSKKKIYIYRKQHKQIFFDEEKALDIAKSYRDVFEIAIENNMNKIQDVIREDFKGELGALIYKYVYQGSKEMNEIVKDCNRLANYKCMNKKLIKQNILLEKDDIYRFVEDNDNVKKELINKLKKLENVYVFGAGIIGKKVVAFLRRNQINIDCILVSDVSKNCLIIGDVLVKQIDEIEIQSKNYIVIIATFWYLHKEIIAFLQERGIKNFYAMDLCRFFLWQVEIVH